MYSLSQFVVPLSKAEMTNELTKTTLKKGQLKKPQTLYSSKLCLMFASSNQVTCLLMASEVTDHQPSWVISDIDNAVNPNLT